MIFETILTILEPWQWLVILITSLVTHILAFILGVHYGSRKGKKNILDRLKVK